MAIARELDYPRWATDGGAAVTEPNEGRKDLGFLEDDEADEAEFNWLHRTTYRNVRWLDESHIGREVRGTTSWRQSTFGFTAGLGLTRTCGAGVVSRAGTRLEFDSTYLVAASLDDHTFPASRDTYVYLDDDRGMTFVDVANGAGAPATPANTTLFQRVVTNVSNVTAVADFVLVGPVLAPSEGLRIAPTVIVGLGDATPPIAYFDVGTAAPTADVARVVNTTSGAGGTVFYTQRWTRASARLTSILDGAASVHAVGNNETDVTAKQWSFAALHYTNAEEPVGLMRAAIDNVDNTVQIGGGASHLNAATRVQLYAAANRTTTTGTMLLELQGASNLVFVPQGFLVLGSQSTTTTPLIRLDKASGAGAEGGIEVREAGSRRWLGMYSPNNEDDLVFWRFSGVTDQGVSLRLRWSSGAVVVNTTAGLSIESAQGSGTRGLVLQTHVGAEGGIFDSENWELKTKVVQTNTNGNEDIVLIDATQIPTAAAILVIVEVLAVEDADESNAYSMECATVFRRVAAANASVSHIQRAIVQTNSAGWGGGPASSSLAAVSGDIVLRCTANNATVRNWTILVRWGRMRALN